jgi:hypothetical protein
MMALFHDMYQQKLATYSLNFGSITLLQEKRDVVKIQDYRSICQLNVSFKILTKVITNRIGLVAEKVICPSQTTLIGCNIMEGVIILNETIHEMHMKNQNGVILKVDFEKAYDKIKWPFLQQTLCMKGFSKQWCAWIESVVLGGHVRIKSQ